MATDNKTNEKKLPEISNVAEHSLGVISVQSFDLEFSNGEQRTYYRIRPSRRSGVGVIAIDGDDLLLTREFAGGTWQYELGIVRGGIDEGEDPYQAASRELREEIGYGAKQITLLRGAHCNTAYHDSNMYLFVAQDLYLDPLEGDEPEPIEIVRYPIAQIDQLLNSAEFRDARNLVALYQLRDYLKLKQS